MNSACQSCLAFMAALLLSITCLLSSSDAFLVNHRPLLQSPQKAKAIQPNTPSWPGKCRTLRASSQQLFMRSESSDPNVSNQCKNGFPPILTWLCDPAWLSRNYESRILSLAKIQRKTCTSRSIRSGNSVATPIIRPREVFLLISIDPPTCVRTRLLYIVIGFSCSVRHQQASSCAHFWRKNRAKGWIRRDNQGLIDMMVGILLRCRRLARLGGMITNTAKEPFVAEGEVSSKMCAIVSR